MKKILVIGGSGKIGKYLLPDLSKDYKIKIFDMVETELINKNVEFFKGDITKLDDLIKSSKDTDAIIHLAAIPFYTGEDEKIMKINVDGTFNVLEACKRNDIRNIIFTSSICAWGAIFWSSPLIPEYLPVDEEISLIPDDMYGLSKLIGEYLCYAYHKRYGINIICLRLATVFFPFEKMFIEARKNIDNPEFEIEPPLTFKDFFWNYVDPRDLPQAYRLALKALEKNEVVYKIYNIGANDVFSTLDSLQLIRKYYPEIKFVKNENSFISGKNRALFDISKAKKELGYNPKYTWRDIFSQ